jgi:hypothetical protein
MAKVVELLPHKCKALVLGSTSSTASLIPYLGYDDYFCDKHECTDSSSAYSFLSFDYVCLIIW